MNQPYCVGRCADAPVGVTEHDPRCSEYRGQATTASSELKAAAAKIRATAGAADHGPWEVGPRHGGHDTAVFIKQTGDPGIDWVGSTRHYLEGATKVFASQVANKTRFRENANHVALWHPGVALLVADVLDKLADDSERNARAWVGLVTTDANGLLTAPSWEAQALALARAINGGQP